MLIPKTLRFSVILFLITVIELNVAFEIPEVTLEAYQPTGFRASIPNQDNIQLFAFHGNLNEEISSMDDGEYHKDVKQATGGKWVYHNPQLQLKPGDFISYWVYVQYDYLGYRRAAVRWNVTKLVEDNGDQCGTSETNAKGISSQICSNSVILSDNFEKLEVDSSKWTVEQYIPYSIYDSPDFEFVSYENNKDIVYINDQNLVLKPKYFDTRRSALDLTKGCTKTPDECKSDLTIYTPPVASGRLASKLSFRFGFIEVRAKLPAGDWIFPEIYLEQENDATKRLWLAYARGNDKLLDNRGSDYGSRLLFAGPITTPEEPGRSRNLVSKRANDPFSKDFHIYTVHWTKDEMKFSIDGAEFGKITKDKMQQIQFPQNEYFKLVLGVGVGGNNDFPDGFRSGNYDKPWKNKDQKQMKDFFNARENWSPTWASDSTLQVDYVKITSL